LPINTRITNVNEYSKVIELGNTVKREVNKLYKTLELEVDGVFRTMLLLKKKKYAAVTISAGPDGQFMMGKETKGLDLVRRDWCIQLKESGMYVLDQILSGDEKDVSCAACWYDDRRSAGWHNIQSRRLLVRRSSRRLLVR
jgi:DNA polymerase alpha subunit A